jgi:hypothetical protein
VRSGDARRADQAGEGVRIPTTVERRVILYSDAPACAEHCWRTVPEFAALVSARPRPTRPGLWLALITAPQLLKGCSDRQAADAVPARIDWKYALSSERTDLGFDDSVGGGSRRDSSAGSASHS